MKRWPMLRITLTMIINISEKKEVRFADDISVLSIRQSSSFILRLNNVGLQFVL